MFSAEILLACPLAVRIAAAAPARGQAGRRTIAGVLAGLLALLAAPAPAADDVERLIGLLRIEEDVRASYDECLAGAKALVEAEVGYEIEERYGDIDLQADDMALLVAIYAEFYQSSCDHLAGDEVLNFYRAEFRRRFDAGEIAGLIAFYRSPLGKKLNGEWLEINRVYGKLLQDRQAVESFAAQRRYERRMDEFWLRYEEKTESAPERGAATGAPQGCLPVAATGACHDPA